MCDLIVDEAYGEAIRQHEHYETTVQDIADLKEAVNDLTGDDEFGRALVDHFPVDDKMPAFCDVQDFLNNRFDTDYDVDTVDLICMIMELHYDVDYCHRCHDDEDALVETDLGYLCSSCARQSVGLPKTPPEIITTSDGTRFKVTRGEVMSDGTPIVRDV